MEKAITERTKAIISVDLAGIISNYKKLFEIAERKRKQFCPSNRIQEKIGRIAVLADAAHGLGANVMENDVEKLLILLAFLFML